MKAARTHANLHDIARHAGVSVSTVSRVLNNHGRIAPATREKVRRISAQLGYRGPRVKASARLVGLVLPFGPTEYLFDLMSGAGTAVRGHGGRVELGVLGDTPFMESGAVTLERFLMSGIDGALLIGSLLPAKDLTALLGRTCPVVVIDPTFKLDSQIPYVDAANFAGGRDAADHLLRLGHTRIGIVTGPLEMPAAADRLAGYHAALAAAGVPIVPELQRLAHVHIDDATRQLPTPTRDDTLSLGYEPALQLLHLPEPPTAIITFTDLEALGVLRAARDCGMDVPEDLSVVGFNDLLISSLVTPALTTVRQPLAEMARTAVDMLYRLMDGESLGARHVTLATNLVIRDSTGPVCTKGRL